MTPTVHLYIPVTDSIACMHIYMVYAVRMYISMRCIIVKLNIDSHVVIVCVKIYTQRVCTPYSSRARKISTMCSCVECVYLFGYIHILFIYNLAMLMCISARSDVDSVEVCDARGGAAASQVVWLPATLQHKK